MNWYKKAQQTPELESILNKWRVQGVTLYVFEQIDKVLLESLIVPRGSRKQGIGTQIMQEITNDIYLRLLNFASQDKFPLLIRCRILYLQQGQDLREYKKQLEAALDKLTNDNNNNNNDTATSKQEVCHLLDTYLVHVINQSENWYKVKEYFKQSLNPAWVRALTSSGFVEPATYANC